MADHLHFQELAIRLIAKNGRVVKLRKLSGAAVDAAKPWLGQKQPVVEVEVEIYAVALPVSSVSQMGVRVNDTELLKRTEKLMLVQPVPLNPNSDVIGPDDIDLEMFNQIETDSTTYKILWSEKLQPADQQLLFVYGIAR